MNTVPELTRLEELARKATPGPWEARRQVNKRGDSLGWIIEHANGRIGWPSYATAIPNEGETDPHPIGGANAAYIAACSPETILALVRVARAAERYETASHMPLTVGTANEPYDAHVGLNESLAALRASQDLQEDGK